MSDMCPKKTGFSQVELLISLVIISTFFMALVAGFAPIAGNLLINKSKTLAVNIAQEKIEKLKAVSYYRLLVSPSPLTYTDPAVEYDDVYYPPESLRAGEIEFTRLTNVQKVQEISGKVTTVSPTSLDTGLKLVTVNVVWGPVNNRKSVQIKNLVSNPRMVATDSVFNGKVRDAATSSPIQNAQVTIAENSGWVDVTDSNGDYSINVLAGSYNLVASAQGYFNQTVSLAIANNQDLTQDFSLVMMASGTVSGYVWQNDHLVISQVVGSSVCADSGFDQEYIEIFNPTTSQFVISDFGVPQVDVLYQSESYASASTIVMNYVNSTIEPGGYYLFANTSTINAGGVSLAADAVFSTINFGYPDVIKTPDAGAIAIRSVVSPTVFDILGWNRNSGAKIAPFFEGQPLNEHIGLEVGEQYIRRTSTMGVTDGHGNCYDSNNNNVDFIRGGLSAAFYRPHNSTDFASAIVAGTVVDGAVITMDDGLSSGAASYLTGSPPVSRFDIPNVATGSWIAAVCANGYLEEISGVSVTGTGVFWIPDAATAPAWDVAGYNNVFLSTVAVNGYIKGRVTDTAGAVINSPLITLTNIFSTIQTDGNGYYVITCAPGIYSVTANPGSLNPSYVTQTQTGINVNVGQITSGVNFILAQGGRINGFCTRDGVNPLPGVLFLAEDSGGISRAEEISMADGYFTLKNMPVGTYRVYPALDSGEISSPTGWVTDITSAGETVFSSTYTISGAFGSLSGSLTYNGDLIRSGVLLVATKKTLSGTPPVVPALSVSTLADEAFYMGSSTEKGTYTLEVRGSTDTYRLYAYYPVLSGGGVSYKYYSGSGFSVTAGSTTVVDIASWLP